MTVNYFGVVVACTYFVVIIVVVAAASLCDDFLSWLCIVFGSLDLAVTLTVCLIAVCECLPSDVARGRVIECDYISGFNKSVNDVGELIYVYKNRSSGRWQYLPASGAVVENDFPAVVVQYELIKFYGTKQFYYDKDSSGVQFVFE